ncbi:MAG: hypothetical protein KAS92_01685 [Candidatus Omnitrophica bacterium]|nr:hypothetical protein [Candidatus Omnitrophota bacterium]
MIQVISCLFEIPGNSRELAKEVFGDREDILVEIEEYHFRNKKDIIRKLNRLRKLNGLI